MDYPNLKLFLKGLGNLAESLLAQTAHDAHKAVERVEDRNDIKQSLKTILKAVDIVNEGYSIFVMPEGTRNHSDELLTFKEGSFKIAEKAGCPVIPVAITNSDALYELHRPWVRKAKIVIHYGTPINVADMPREERKTLGSRVRHEIELMLEEDKKLIN